MDKEYENIKVIGFDADDTLWVNETYFREAELEFAKLLSEYETPNKIDQELFKIEIGKSMLDKPVELLDGVEEVLKVLSTKYRLILATKGDLLDQERKLVKSGLMDYFHHIEVLSDKKEANYSKLLNHLDIEPSQFLMIGNSLKSDILPLVNLKANAIHIPFHTTWAHEQVSEKETNGKAYKTLNSLRELLNLLD